MVVQGLLLVARGGDRARTPSWGPGLLGGPQGLGEMPSVCSLGAGMADLGVTQLGPDKSHWQGKDGWGGWPLEGPQFWGEGWGEKCEIRSLCQAEPTPTGLSL